jgi:hypothetical protein
VLPVRGRQRRKTMMAMTTRRNNGGRDQCHLCFRPAEQPPLCTPCREMIARLARIWPEVNPVTRGMLHYRSLQAAAESAKPAGKEKSSAGQAGRG